MLRQWWCDFPYAIGSFTGSDFGNPVALFCELANRTVAFRLTYLNLNASK
jgi:hypothetical protein